MICFRAAVIVTLAAVLASPANAAIFQYALPVETSEGERTAYLWIPPEAKQVRGLVVAGMTLAEREIVSDPRIRKACAGGQLGILFFKGGLGLVDVQDALDRFAEESGYEELTTAPMLFIGHSAGGPAARRLARKFHVRCLGLVQYRGGDPGDIDNGGLERIFSKTPALMMLGQFDEFGKIGRKADGTENWEKDRDKLIALRQRGDRPVSVVVEPGAGHFGWSDRSSKYLALFIASAAISGVGAEQMVDIEENPFGGEPVNRKEQMIENGWLTDVSIKPPLHFRAVSHRKFNRPLDAAMWHFNWHLAAATEAYHQGLNRKDQFIVWTDRHTVEAGARNFFDEPSWVDDGQTFVVAPEYADTYPTTKEGGAIWAQGGGVENSSQPIEIRRAGGPIEKVGDRMFRIKYDELAPATEESRITFMAYSKGNAEFRYTERVGMLREDASRVSEGKPQKITFPPLANMTEGNRAVSLAATSDSGLPVEYHIAHGPAKIVEGRLVISEVPKRAKFPIEVTVVAYQFGRMFGPKVQSAEPVLQTIRVTK